MIEIGYNRIPDEYQELEYIESDGSQYINTGYHTTSNTHVHAKLFTRENVNKNWFGGSGAYGVLGEAYVLNSRSENTYELAYGDSGWQQIATTEVLVGKIFVVDFNKQQNIYINDNPTYSLSGLTKTTDSSPLWLFGRYLGTNFIAGRVYEFKIYENSILSQNLIPARRLADDVVGMFDTVTNTFLTNAGSGEFIAGPVVTPHKAIIKDKVVTNGSGTPSTASKVYVGDKLVHLHKKDNTPFTSRQTCNGEIREGNDLYGTINNIKGNTVVWNQRMPQKSGITINGGTYSDGIYSMAVTQGDEYKSLSLQLNNSYRTSVTTYDKIYVSFSLKLDNSKITQLKTFMFDENGNNYNKNVLVNTNFQRKSFIFSNNILNGRLAYFQIRYQDFGPSPVAFTYSLKDDIVVIDLTQMFGAGNEPSTVEEFEAMFPEDYYPYDAGSLLSFTGTGLKSVGFNLWDEEWESGLVNPTDGAPYHDSECIRTKNYNKCLPNTTYYIASGYSSRIKFVFYDEEFNICYSPDSSLTTNTLYTTTAESRYFKFYVRNVENPTYLNNICISLSNTQFNGTYKPYCGTTTNFDISAILDDNSNQVFPDGLRKAGSVYDEIVTENGVTKAIKRVGSVDMGTLDWDKNALPSNPNGFRAPCPSDATKREVLCAKYPSKFATSSNSWITNSKTLFYGHENANYGIVVTEDNTVYTTTSAFQAAVSGVILYYELATPEEYILSDINLPLYYPANGLGTEEIVTSSTSTPATAPANMNIEYRLEEEEWYGIRWKMTDSDWVEPKRIGNPNLHRSLPLHNMMKRCALNNGVPKFISDIDVDKYEDGTTVDYATTNIHVRVPEYYFEATQDSSGNCELRLHTKIKKGTRSRLYYPGAWRAAIDANNIAVSKSYIDFSTLSQIGYPANNTYNASLFKDNTYFVSGVPTGGDSSARSGTEGCTIGRPKTRWDYSATPKNLTISVFRDCAKRNDSATGSANRYGIINYDCWCSIMRLFAVEFCTFNSQADIDDSLTQPLGFKQGGLSAGVTTVTNAAPYSWNDLNGYNPLIPCGITKSLGNRTDAIAFKYSAGTIAAGEKSVSVPSYRGIEEPFGDIHCFVDGIFFYGVVADFKNYVYVATDETMTDNSYTTPSATPADPSVPPTGYELLTDALPGGPSSGSSVVNSGWSKVWKWDKHGMFVPISYGGNGSNYMRDYAYSYNGGWKMLLAGGSADYGGRAGLGCFSADGGVGSYYASFGSRLLYTPQ